MIFFFFFFEMILNKNFYLSKNFDLKKSVDQKKKICVTKNFFNKKLVQFLTLASL